MTRTVAFLVIAALFTACSSNSPAPSASSPSSSTSDAFTNLDSVTWPSTQADVLSLYRRMPARIGDHERVELGISSLGATYGSPNPNKADVMTYAMTVDEAAIQTPVADPLGELRRLVSDAPDAQEEASFAGGSDASAYLAVVASVNRNDPTEQRHVIYWLPPEQAWVYALGAKDVDDRDAALTAMIEAAAASGSTVTPPPAPLGLDAVQWPDAAGAKAMLAAMPATVAGLPKGQIRYGEVLTYGDGGAGYEPIQIALNPVPSDHRGDIAQAPMITIAMGFSVKKVESSNDDPATPLVWFEAQVDPLEPGGMGGYAVAWARTDGSVVYAVVAKTAEQRSAAVEAMAASIPA